MPMLLIGTGAGMPWGLMDDVAIGVVPKDRSGMAAGIFNTARVAGEGVTLAIAGAVMAALSYRSLTELTSQTDNVSVAKLSVAALHISKSDISGALALAPQLTQHAAADAYSEAFPMLVHVLTGVTLLAALAAFVFLARVQHYERCAKDRKGRQELKE